MRRLETHPKTGAAQIVEIRERIEEVVVPRYVEEPPCAELSAEQLASWGIPSHHQLPRLGSVAAVMQIRCRSPQGCIPRSK